MDHDFIFIPGSHTPEGVVTAINTNLIENFNKHLKRNTNYKEQLPIEDSLGCSLVSQFNADNEKSLKRIHQGFKEFQDTLKSSFT